MESLSPDFGKLHLLGEDYHELDEQAQTMRRVLAVAKRATPEEFVRAWSLFRSLYFFPLPKGKFYTHGRKPSPECHYQWINDFMAHGFNAIGAPRDSAKSTVLGKELPLMLALTQPYTITVLALASYKKVQERMDELMGQLETNPFILHDFGVQKPKRGGAGIWNHEQLNLLNGSVIKAISVDQRKLGLRPHYIILDDPEYNPEVQGNETQLLKDLDKLIFDEMMPMLEDDGKFMWIGTLLTRRAALWYACMSDDSRFSYWNRRVYSMVQNDAQGRTHYLWEQKWDAKSVAGWRRKLGPASFEAQFQNNPISKGARILSIHDPLDLYDIQGDTVRWKVVGTDGGVEVFEKPYDEWLAGLGRIFTVDPAMPGRHHDYSSILAVGIDADKIWWILDNFVGQVNDKGLTAKLYSMGLQYQPIIVGVESIGFQELLRQSIESAIEEGTAGTSWQPRVWPIKYPGKLSKPERIVTIAPRMARHAIKFPAHLRTTTCRQLFEQINNFTMDLALLPNDDAADTLGMVPYCPRVSPVGLIKNEKLTDPISLLLAGYTHDPVTGFNLGMFIDINTLDPRVAAAIRDARQGKRNKALSRARASTAQARMRQLGSTFQRKSAIIPYRDTQRKVT